MKQFLSNGKEALEVMSCYNYTYNYGRGKEVLRVAFNSEKYDFQKCLDFLTNCSEFIQYESENDAETRVNNMKMVNKYNHYLRDITSTYSQPEHKFEFEIVRIDDIERATAANSNDILNLTEMVAIMYEESFS